MRVRPLSYALAVVLGKVGRSEAVYVAGKVKDFLNGLGLAELVKADSGTAPTARPAVTNVDLTTTAFWYGLKDRVDLAKVKEAIEGVATYEQQLNRERLKQLLFDLDPSEAELKAIHKEAKALKQG